MSAYKCEHCQDTGESTGNGQLDCSKCDAASTCAALNDMVKALGPITREDLAWAAYQAGVAASDKRHATEVAELAAMVRQMWGWAVELDADCIKGLYFDYDTLEGKESMMDWQSDMLEGAALAKKYGK